MENNKIKILAIDDNSDNLISLKALIQDSFPDSEIFLANNGESGLNLALVNDPDVILLDIVMPNMDGFEVCKRLKSDDKLKDIPVVFITALKADKDGRIKALDCGAEAFLAKPIDENELTAQLKAMEKIKRANRAKYNEKEKLEALVLERTRQLNKTHRATLNLLEDLKKENEARRQSEEALIISEKKYRTIFENVQDVFYQITVDGQILDISPSVKHFSQFNRDELVGHSVNILYLDLNDRVAFLKDLEKKGELRDYEIRFVTKNGEIVYVSVNARLIYDSQGIATHIDGAMRDVTLRKLAENELVKAKERAEESDRLKSAFLTNMSHEIRTPMNGILGFASLLKEPRLSGEEQQEYIKVIEECGSRMLNIINDIINISKVESGLMEIVLNPTNINEQVEYLYSFFKLEAEQKGIKLTYKLGLSCNDANIVTDKEKLYAILTNLIKNAIKFTQKGFIEYGYIQENDRVKFYVTDSGTGIRDDQKEIIFERFRQGSESNSRNYEGAGLGLSISKAYVEMLGGSIWFDSILGKGTTFYFTIKP